MLKKLLLVLSLILIFSSLITAANILVTTSKIEGSVEPGSEAVHIIKIKNRDIRDNTFQLKSETFAIAPFSDIVENIIFEPSSAVLIPSNQEREVKVKIKFLDSVKPDRNYITKILIKALTDPGIKEETSLTTYIIPSVELIEIDAILPGEIIPGEKSEILVNLTNKGASNLENLEIFYSSSIFNLEDETSLAPFENKLLKFNLEIDPLTAKDEYSLTIRLFKDDKIKGSKNFEFSVGQNPDLRERELITKGFLSSTIEIVRENEGNVEIERTVSYPISLLATWFTKTNPPTEIIVDETGRRYEWNFNIPPGSIYRIEIQTDYKWLFFSIVAILLFIIAVFYLKQKNIFLKKEIFKIGETKTGVSELKILLHIRNKTYKEIYNVKVIDLLPRFFNLEQDFGTLKPTKMQESMTGGFRLIWQIEKLEPGEERVISYKVNSKLPLVGRNMLPAALVQYFGRGKRLVNVKSNRLVFMTKE